MGIQNRIGQTLGQCVLLELLGAGDMNAVLQGLPGKPGPPGGRHGLPPISVEPPGFLECFNREARTLAALEHPHIVRIYDFGTQDGMPSWVLHLLSGGTLAQRLPQHEVRREPLPELGTMAETLRQLAGALDYVHPTACLPTALFFRVRRSLARPGQRLRLCIGPLLHTELQPTWPHAVCPGESRVAFTFEPALP